jgi:predicted RNA binding protein YcfA (HicA-like mRNA interferase family)
MPVKFRELERMLNKDGWKLDRITGSHHIYTHPTKKGTVTVPFQGVTMR